MTFPIKKNVNNYVLFQFEFKLVLRFDFVFVFVFLIRDSHPRGDSLARPPVILSTTKDLLVE